LRQIPKNARRNNDHDLIAVATKLAHAVGLSGDVKLERLSGGRNNQVFKIMADDQRFILKSYFIHEDDPRDRLDNEFSFLRYAWDKGIRCIPQPLSADKKQYVALYEFIDGERLRESDITKEFIEQAIRFILELNKYKNTDEAINLPFASEACFSIEEHLNCVEQRLKRLCEIEPCDSVSKNAYDFIKRQLIPCWMTLKKRISEKLDNSDIDINEVINNEERCLSPSDFGFHNALRERNGKLRFIDFEYAGWDDPVKLICDFFCQPQIPVSTAFLPLIEREVTHLFNKREELKERIVILFPVYRIKWCCIMLNEFKPEGYARRIYAEKDVETRRKEEQLEKVKIYLSETLNYC
jgi:hypothetical protein